MLVLLREFPYLAEIGDEQDDIGPDPRGGTRKAHPGEAQDAGAQAMDATVAASLKAWLES